MKKFKNALQLFVILSLVTTTLVSLNPVYASPGAQVSVEGGGINSSIEPGMSFSVNINVAGITSVMPLLGYEFKLGYYTNVLNVTSLTIGDFLEPDIQVWRNEVNEAEGLVWLAISQVAGESGVSGGGLLAKIEFKVEIWGGTPLDLYDTKLACFDPVKNDAVPIEHDVIDGEFSNVGRLPLPSFSWEPLNPVVETGATFDGTGSVAQDGKTIVSWDWDFGDGEIGSGSVIEHAFIEVGIYTVTLKVTDNATAMAKVSQTVWVIPPQIAVADLVERKAWAEHKNFDKSREMMWDGNVTNSLYASVQSFGGFTVVVKAVFRVTDALTGFEIKTIETQEIGLANYLETYTFDTALDVIPNWTEFDTTSITTQTKFNVEVKCLYMDPNIGIWQTAVHKKTFSFTVKL